jgi:hypothetical protein
MGVNEAIGWLLVGVVLSQLALLVLAAGRSKQQAGQYERERKHRDNSVDK